MKKLILIIALTSSSTLMAQTYDSPLKSSRNTPDMSWVESKDGESKIIGGTPDEMERYAEEFISSRGGSVDSPDDVVMSSNVYYVNDLDGSKIKVSYMKFDNKQLIIVKK